MDERSASCVASSCETSAVDESTASISSSLSVHDASERLWRSTYASYRLQRRELCNDGACHNASYCNGMCRSCYERSRSRRCKIPYCRRRATLVRNQGGDFVSNDKCIRCASVAEAGTVTGMMHPPKRRQYCKTTQCRRSAHNGTPHCRLCNEAIGAGTYEAHVDALRANASRRRAAYERSRKS